jgi:hypothetical protein
MITGQEQYYLERAGYFVRRGALPPEVIAECLDAAERVVQKCRDGRYEHIRWSDDSRDDFWGVNHLLHPAIRETTLVNVLAHPGLRDPLEDALPPPLRYHLATLLVSPARKPYELAWHRDLGPDLDEPDDAQRAHLARFLQHLQLNAALLDDESLWVVPGTHAEPLLPEQYAAVKQDQCGDVPGQVCARLAAGDVVFYNANLLHRGWNRKKRPRRTLHATFVSLQQPDQPVYPQPWLADLAFLKSLPARLRPFVERFLAFSA